MPMHISVADVQTWLEPVKSNIDSIDPTMEQHISGLVLGRLLDSFSHSLLPLSAWVDEASTPLLVRQAIAMLYAAWYYDRQYSEVAAKEGAGFGTAYGALLRQSVEQLIAGLISGAILLQEEQPSGPTTVPLFYPDDVSSTDDALRNNTDSNDVSLGPVMFGVSKVF